MPDRFPYRWHPGNEPILFGRSEMRHAHSYWNAAHSWRSIFSCCFTFSSANWKHRFIQYIKTFCRPTNSYFRQFSSFTCSWMHRSVFYIETVSLSALLWLLFDMSTAAAIFTCRFQCTVLAAATIPLRLLAHKECITRRSDWSQINIIKFRFLRFVLLLSLLLFTFWQTKKLHRF